MHDVVTSGTTSPAIFLKCQHLAFGAWKTLGYRPKDKVIVFKNYLGLKVGRVSIITTTHTILP